MACKYLKQRIISSSANGARKYLAIARHLAACAYQAHLP